MDFIVRYRVRRHLSASAPRGEGKSPPGMIQAKKADRHKKTGPMGSCFRIIRCSATSIVIVAAVEAGMMMMVVVMVGPAVSRRHPHNPGPISAAGSVTVMVKATG